MQSSRRVLRGGRKRSWSRPGRAEEEEKNDHVRRDTCNTRAYCVQECTGRTVRAVSRPWPFPIYAAGIGGWGEEKILKKIWKKAQHRSTTEPINNKSKNNYHTRTGVRVTATPINFHRWNLHKNTRKGLARKPWMDYGIWIAEKVAVYLNMNGRPGVG